MDSSEKSKDEIIIEEEKREYIKPEIEEENLVAYGAACTGVAGGGFKSSSGAPDYCNPAKLLS